MCLHSSCTHEFPLSDCAAKALEEGDWIPYREQKLSEDGLWKLYESEWREEIFFETFPPFGSFIAMPINCDGNPLSNSYTAPVLDTFWRESSDRKLIGYRKD